VDDFPEQYQPIQGSLGIFLKGVCRGRIDLELGLFERMDRPLHVDAGGDQENALPPARIGDFLDFLGLFVCSP
jgi:hypothetical protein